MATRTSESSNPFQFAADGFKAAMDTGLKFQEQAVKMMTQAPLAGDAARQVRRRFETFTAESTELARKNAAQAQRLFDEACRSGMDLIRKSCESVEANGDTSVVQRAESLWRDAFDAMRTGVDAVAAANTEMIRNYADFVNVMMKDRQNGQGDE